MTDIVPIRRALISLSDKSGLETLAAGLAKPGSSWYRPAAPQPKLRELGHRGPRHQRTHRLPRDDGRAGQDASPQGPWRAARGARQCRACPGDGRARHRRDRPGRGQPLPVRGDRGEGRAARDEIIENIDIGGPSMVRSAAKNHAFVAIVTDPADYAECSTSSRGKAVPTSPSAASSRPRPMP